MMRTTLFAALFAILFFQISGAQTNVPAGNVSGAWTYSGSPYHVQGNILVPDGQTLVIEPGVTVIFDGYYKLFCNGRIQAFGTADLPISFTVEQANIPTGWQGIRFEDTPVTNGASTFHYCNVEYARGNNTNNVYGGAFYIKNYSGVTFDHCNISNNFAMYGGGAINCENASPWIKYCVFSWNTSYNGGDCLHFLNSQAIIEGNNISGGGVYGLNSSLTIRGNSIFGSVEGAISSFSSTASVPMLDIRNNLLQDNYNENGAGGGAILLHNSSATIEHNLIAYNHTEAAGGAISLVRQYNLSNITTTVISNNLIYRNNSGPSPGAFANGGGGIFCYNNSPKIINNTICFNAAPDAGGALACEINSDPLLYNNIFYHNTVASVNQNIYLDDNNSDPSFYNNDIEGGMASMSTNGNPFNGAYTANIDLVPGFADADGNDFTLMSGSPCVNSGLANLTGLPVPDDDFGGNVRIQDAVIDIGAYEFQGLGIGNHDLVRTFSFYPNPASSVITFGEDVTAATVYDLGGRVVKTLALTGVSADISALASGVYLVKVSNDSGSAFSKLIKK